MHCGDPSSLDCTVRVTNGCAERVWVQICFGQTSGTNDCGLSDAAPGGTVSYWSCGCTNRYFVTGNEEDDYGTGCIPDL